MTTLVEIRKTALMTRPADTTAYASGDLVANSTTVGSVVPMIIATGNAENQPLFIRRIRLIKSATALANASFRAHFFSASPTLITSGDNGATFNTTTPLCANVNDYAGAMDVTCDRNFTDGAFGVGVPMNGNEINMQLVTEFMYILLEARAAYTPASAETFAVTIEAHRY